MKLPKIYRTLEALTEALADCRGHAVHLVVLHDPQCSPLGCRCQPDYVLEPLTVDNIIAGQRAQAKWAREALS